jgi:aminoacrylate hydrolase
MYFEILGSKKPNAPTVVFSSGLGGSARFWQAQLPALKSGYKIVVYDQNGTGRSPASLPINYSIQSMADELLTLLDNINIARCHFIGHALGGLVGLSIALQRPEMLQSLVLVNAWSSPNPHTLRCFTVRQSLLMNCPPEMYLQAQALFLYPPYWIMSNIDRLEQEEQHMLEYFPNRDNLLIRINALSHFDMDSQLGTIKTDTLVVANKDDMLVPWQRSQMLTSGLANATLRTFDSGGHACTITEPEMFNELLLEHLAGYDAK